MDWILGLTGGIMIGLGAVVLMGTAGRIAGISGVAGGLISPVAGDWLWRLIFVGGLIGGAGVTRFFLPGHFEPAAVSGGGLVLAGALVGFGATLGNGCTSGHGVCGLARLSRRSFVAVGAFMLTAILTVWVVRHVL